MTEFVITFARPAEPTDCVPPPVATLLGHPGNLRVAYLRLGASPLADLNDDPDEEENYDRGLDLWVGCVQQLFAACAERWGGRPVQLAMNAASRRVIGARHEWAVEQTETIDRTTILSMTDFAWDPVLWTSLAGPSPFGSPGPTRSGS